MFQTVTVNVAQAQQPVVNLLINNGEGPVSVTSGSSVTLSWTSTNATSCTASGGWSGTKSLNGSETISNITQGTSFVLGCSNTGVTQSDSAVVNIQSTNPPGNSGSGGGGGGAGSPPVDTTPPNRPASLLVLGVTDGIYLQWQNPTETDYVRTVVVRKENSGPTSRTDGVVVYEGTANRYTDNTVLSGRTYHYAVFAFDTSSNYSIGVNGASSLGAFTEAQAQAQLSGIPTTPTTPCTPTTGGGTGLTLARGLVQGSSGEDVRQLQRFLNANGFTVAASGAGSPGNESTYFGPATTAAVKRFQCARGVTCSGEGYGLVGPRTRAALAQGGAASCVPTTPTTPTTPTAPGSVKVTITRPLYLNVSGEDVRQLQRFLNANGFTVATSGAGSSGNETTFFGPATERAVQKYQCARGIICSGYGYGSVGPKTRAQLNVE
jgi:peptidoglycan hydrolase-like protein with peptidoglycan-binding domain